MTLEQIQQAIAQLSPADRAQLRAWLAQTEAGPPRPAPEAGPAAEAASAESAAEKFGRIAGRTFADLRKRIREP